MMCTVKAKTIKAATFTMIKWKKPRNTKYAESKKKQCGKFMYLYSCLL